MVSLNCGKVAKAPQLNGCGALKISESWVLTSLGRWHIKDRQCSPAECAGDMGPEGSSSKQYRRGSEDWTEACRKLG